MTKKWTEAEKDEWVRRIGIMNGWGEPSAPFHSCPKNIVERCNDSCDKCGIAYKMDRVKE